MNKLVSKPADTAALDPKDLLEDVLKHLKTATEAVGERADDALQDAMRAIAVTAERLAKDIKKRGRKAVRKTGRTVAEHPVAATAIATAAIALVGLMVSYKASGRDR